MTESPSRIAVVGIGADGSPGLAPASLSALARSEVLFGSPRQLSSVAAEHFSGERIAWPTPLMATLESLLRRYSNRRRCVLASGDPMFHGIGCTLATMLGSSALEVFSHPSSVSLAAARLGWALHDVEVVSLLTAPATTLLPALTPGRRILVLARNDSTVIEVADLLRAQHLGPTSITALCRLGAVDESATTATAQVWSGPAADDLTVLALAVAAGDARVHISPTPGLPDENYGGDGQLTKAEVRALTLAALAPAAGELLWDVGGGSGSVAIEWLRTHPTCRAEIFEQVASRRETITKNASALGVPRLRVHGSAPQNFPAGQRPDAVFVGGGVTNQGLLERCWQSARPGGRVVVNAVTAESESLVLQWYQRHGGVLRRFQIYRGEPLGSFTTWRPHLPVTQWVATTTRERKA